MTRITSPPRGYYVNKQPSSQQELLRFLQLMDERIDEVQADKARLSLAVATLEARLYALEKQRNMALDIKQEHERKWVSSPSREADKGEHPEWITLEEARQYADLPQPSTIRAWIRSGKLTENQHFSRVGAKKKIYLNPQSILEEVL